MPRREQLEEMLKAAPDDVFLHYALAMTYVSEGDSETAVAKLEDVIHRNPDYVAAYFQQGQVLAREGETERARDVIARGIEAARRVGDSHAAAEMTGFLETLS